MMRNPPREPSSLRTLLLAMLMILAASSACPQEILSTLAGSPLQSGSIDGTNTEVRFNDPAGLAVDPFGNIYIADSRNHTIRRIRTNGVVATFAGTAGQASSLNGMGTGARFDSPSGVAADRSGTVYVADTGNHTIRRISSNGLVSTLAGLAATAGFTDGPASLARFNSPLGIAVDDHGAIFVADTGNHTIRRISNGVVTTLAGSAGEWGTQDGLGLVARFNGPIGLVVGPDRDLFVSDANNYTIRRVSTAGVVTTIAGLADVDGCVDGVGTVARFCKPAGLALDLYGTLYVADSYNHVIRKITPAGNVATIAGAPGRDGSTDGANGRGRFFNPYGLAFDALGNLVITDTYNETIRSLLVPIQIFATKAASGQVRLAWSSLSGQYYQVQFKDSLDDDAPWQDLGGVLLGTSSEPSVFLDNLPPVPSQRYYRVRLLAP